MIILEYIFMENGRKLPFPYLGLREFAGGVGGIVRLLGHQALAVVPAGRRQRSAAAGRIWNLVVVSHKLI
jgi:hypothetical protein